MTQILKLIIFTLLSCISIYFFILGIKMLFITPWDIPQKKKGLWIDTKTNEWRIKT